jgi:hypothetical protein
MQLKPKAEREPEHPTEDDVAQANLGGPRGSPELKSGELTPRQRKVQMPTGGGSKPPGHTA